MKKFYLYGAKQRSPYGVESLVLGATEQVVKEAAEKNVIFGFTYKFIGTTKYFVTSEAQAKELESKVEIKVLN